MERKFNTFLSIRFRTIRRIYREVPKIIESINTCFLSPPRVYHGFKPQRTFLRPTKCCRVTLRYLLSCNVCKTRSKFSNSSRNTYPLAILNTIARFTCCCVYNFFKQFFIYSNRKRNSSPRHCPLFFLATKSSSSCKLTFYFLFDSNSTLCKCRINIRYWFNKSITNICCHKTVSDDQIGTTFRRADY